MSRPAAEIFACIVTILLCGILINEASTLPPGSFDPLGSASVPIATSYILIGLALAILVRRFIAHRNGADGIGDDHVMDAKATRLVLIRVGGFVSLSLLYVFLSSQRILHFLPMTIGFLLIALLLLNGVSRRSIAISVAVSSVIPVALYLCFTRVFTVDLPGAF